MTAKRLLWNLALAVLAGLSVAQAQATELLRVALIEPLSGPFANIGHGLVRGVQMEFERLNAQGGVLGRRLELVSFDSKSSAQEGALQVQAAIDQGIRFIMQASGSNVGHAVTDAVSKYNARNPDKPVLYLNYGALDPALTEDKCHFWHFRFVAHGHMIMNAVVDAIARRPHVRRVYLINQDYAWGHGVAKDAQALLADRRPDIEIVGEDLHAIGKVKDFAPYVAKIKASNADAIVTGNWGNDLALLVKAVKDTGLTVEIHAPIAGLQGAATAMGEAGVDRVRAVLFWHPNLPATSLLAHARHYRARYKEDWNWLPVHLMAELLARAIKKAESMEPLAVARALEGIRYASPTGEVWMRAEDHQLMMPLFETVFARAGNPGVTHDAEGTGFGWKTEGMLDTEQNVPSIVCRVQKP